MSSRPNRRRAPQRLLVPLAVALSLAGGTARAETPQTARAVPTLETVPGEALVRFRDGTPAPLRAVAHARAGARVLRTISGIGYDVVTFPGALAGTIDAYRADPSVAIAEPNHAGRAAISPGDSCIESCTGIPGQWHLLLTNSAYGWDAHPGRTYTAAEKRALAPVTIAVLDTKVDAAHPDFVNKGGTSSDARDGGQLDLADARDWVPADRWKGSVEWHGTLVAGLAAAATGNDADAAGLGYRATILPLTVIDGSGRAEAASVAEAIVYAWQRGARIINLSLGITGDSAAVRDALRLVTAGTPAHPPSLVVAAAGNNTGSTPFYPGSYPEAMSVSGTDANDQRASCSNYNSNVSVSAPADRLVGLAQMPVQRMQAPCGTSAAAPQVSGLAALLFSQDPSRTPADVRSIIERTADDLGAAGRDDPFGHGRINAERALRGGPRTTGARATTPPAAGGASTITATATASGGVRAARVVFDKPGAAAVAMQPADGTWGGTTEVVRATITIPVGLPAGPHPVFVRASDGTTWGPTTLAVVPIDQRAPVISSATAENAVRAAGKPLSVSFSLADDRATTFVYEVQVTSTAPTKLLHSRRTGGVPAGSQTVQWQPGLDTAGGHVTITITAFDAAGNQARATLGAIVL